MSIFDNVATVVIGRNEGSRLSLSLASIPERLPVVYVDSGSEDGSVTSASDSGADVIELDTSMRFTAARARNAGFREVVQHHPGVHYVQFVDGDCVLDPDWIEIARQTLETSPQVGIVCGALTERDPLGSRYNRLCSLEWKSAPGETQACGGIFMARREAFEAVGGFNESLIAGEEPELCHRMRVAGWSILRFDAPMATHDAAMTMFSQWWRRAVRSGHAYAERAWLHRGSPSRPWRREVRRDWIWGVILPGTAIAAAWPTGGWSLLLFALYPTWTWKISSERRRRFGESTGDAYLYAGFAMLSKFPSVLGQSLYWARRARRAESTLIEYKTPE